jgi:hypothetical protein
MKARLACLALAVLAGCASVDGRGLEPGTPAAQVEDLMGPAADSRKQANGETWLYFKRQPYGRQNYVARIDPDGRLIAIEQRLHDENLKLVQAGTTTRDEVRNLFGPPASITDFPRMKRETWEYRMFPTGSSGAPMILYVQFSPDGVTREVYQILESSEHIGPPGLRIGF